MECLHGPDHWAYFSNCSGKAIYDFVLLWKQQPRITAREIAMASLMNSITDIDKWHTRVFEHDELIKLREAALREPLISEDAWMWCRRELQDKARFTQVNDYTVVLNVGSSVCKSDSLVPNLLTQQLKEQTKSLKKNRAASRKGRVQDLVDPNMFPLIFGRSQVLEAKVEVDLEDVFASMNRNTTVLDIQDSDNINDMPTPSNAFIRERDHSVQSSRWSHRFQWLPCEVKFTSSDSMNTDVEIQSYINSLHPIDCRSMYATIERLIGRAIGAWNSCLIRNGETRAPLRIRTYGFETLDVPDFCDERTLSFWDAGRTPDGPERIRLVENVKRYYETLKSKFNEVLPDEAVGYDLMDLLQAVGTDYERLNHFRHPEPGTAYSYEDWVAGRTGRAIIEKRDCLDYWSKGENVEADPDQGRYSIRLQDKFRAEGLRIVVKLSSIELDQDAPSFPGQDWYSEALMNEHIVATAVYYYDVENITESRVSFRQATEMERKDYHFYNLEARHAGVDTYEALAAVFGFSYDKSKDFNAEIPNTQELGACVTREGRFLAWPNTLEHRIEPFGLADASKPGHRNCIVFYLVDPHYRIPSTMSVPPQQHGWWAEAALSEHTLEPVVAARNMPPEIRDMIADATRRWPIGMDEAREISDEMKRDREIAHMTVTALNKTVWSQDVMNL